MILRLAVAACLLLSGCLGDEAVVDAAPEEASAAEEPFLLEWNGYVAHGMVDVFMHVQPTEPLLYAVQPAGFSMEIPDQPEAIEVQVAWDGDAGFYLHPHYVVEEEPAMGGTTTYYGYFSDLFETSPGCIRIPADDMAAGTWQMMIHPTSNTVDTDFTITVGIVGAQGKVLPEMHGHRFDGETDLQDHGWEPCQLLG